MNDVYLQSLVLRAYVTLVVTLTSFSKGCLHLYRFCIQNKVTGSMVVSSDSAPMALQSGVMRVMKGMSFCIQMATNPTTAPFIPLPLHLPVIPLHLQFKRCASRTLWRHARAEFRWKFRIFVPNFITLLKRVVGNVLQKCNTQCLYGV
jgi:hypothetical protein